MLTLQPPYFTPPRSWSHRLAVLGLIAASVGCAADAETAPEVVAPVRVDCAHAETEGLSVFAIDEFRRDLAIHTGPRLAEHLDRFPELICRELTSDRHGALSPIAYAAGHRPDAHLIFPMLIERGAQAADARSSRPRMKIAVTAPSA